MPDREAPRPDSLGLLLAVVAGMAIGAAGRDVEPLVLGAFADALELAPAAAGLVASVELATLAAVSILWAGRIARGSRARHALVGALLVIAGQLVAAGLHGYAPLLATRVVVGAGSGLMIAAASAAAAGSTDPDRLFAQAALLGGLLMAGVLGALPLAIAPGGYAAAFVCLAALTLAALPFLRSLPRGDELPHASPGGRAPNRWRATLALGSVGATSLGQGAVWAFSERIGLAAGLSGYAVGIVLGVSTLLGLGGAGVAAWLGTRYGRTLPLLGGLAASVAATLAIVSLLDPVVFVAGQLVWGVCFMFAMPYLMGLLAALDPEGRWTATAAGVSSIGIALGPAAGGLLVRGDDWADLASLVIVCGLLAVGLLAPVLRALDREQAAALPPPAPAPALRSEVDPS